MPADDRQCLGVDGDPVRPVPRVRARSVPGVQRALVRRSPRAARRLLRDPAAAPASDLAQLLPARAPRRVGRIPDVRDRLTAFIATPAPAGTTAGNRVTALRWARRLRELGWRVLLAAEWAGEPCDLLVALHAHKSHASLARHARARPEVPRVLALTGTDLYDEVLGGLLDDPIARASLELATRVVVLQPLALRWLPEPVRGRARVILQSAAAPPPAPAQPGFTACALAHLRDVKD